MERNRKEAEERIAASMREIPLKIRLYVLNEMMIQSHLVEIGVIPDGYWSDEKEKKYGKLFRPIAKKLTKFQLQEIKEWEKDGRPGATSWMSDVKKLRKLK
jgi:hypothetical protein